MKRVAQFLIRLYPPSWRARYGEEFEALIEDSPVAFSGIFDLVKGAIKMRLSAPAFPKLALVLSVSGLLAGLLVSFTVTPAYVSRAVMRFSGGDASRTAIECQQVIANMREKDIKVKALPGNAVQITFAYPDREKAQQTVNTLLARFIETNFKRRVERLNAGQFPARFTVQVIPGLPVRPARPNRVVFLCIGFTAGLVLAVVIALSRHIPLRAASA
jgi:capsular polysaccharide biosynthesis protein